MRRWKDKLTLECCLWRWFAVFLMGSAFLDQSRYSASGAHILLQTQVDTSKDLTNTTPDHVGLIGMETHSPVYKREELESIAIPSSSHSTSDWFHTVPDKSIDEIEITSILNQNKQTQEGNRNPESILHRNKREQDFVYTEGNNSTPGEADTPSVFEQPPPSLNIQNQESGSKDLEIQNQDLQSHGENIEETLPPVDEDTSIPSDQLQIPEPAIQEIPADENENEGDSFDVSDNTNSFPELFPDKINQYIPLESRPMVDYIKNVWQSFKGNEDITNVDKPINSLDQNQNILQTPPIENTQTDLTPIIPITTEDMLLHPANDAISSEITPQDSQFEYQQPLTNPESINENDQIDLKPFNANTEDVNSNPISITQPLALENKPQNPQDGFQQQSLDIPENDQVELQPFIPNPQDLYIQPQLIQALPYENITQDSQLLDVLPPSCNENDQADLNPFNPNAENNVTPDLPKPISYENLQDSQPVIQQPMNILQTPNQNDPMDLENFNSNTEEVNNPNQFTQPFTSENTPPQSSKPGHEQLLTTPESSNQNDQVELQPFNQNTQDLHIQPPLIESIPYENIHQDSQPEFELPSNPLESYNQNAQENLENLTPQLTNPISDENVPQDSQPLGDSFGNNKAPNSELENFNPESSPFANVVNIIPQVANPVQDLQPSFPNLIDNSKSPNENHEVSLMDFASPSVLNENLPHDSQLGFQQAPESSNQNDQINFEAFNPNSEDVVTPQLDNPVSNENSPQDSQPGFQPLIDSLGTFVNGNTDIPNPVLEYFIPQFDTNTQDANIIPQISNPVFNPSESFNQNEINLKPLNQDVTLPLSNPVAYENLPQGSQSEFQQPATPELSNQNEQIEIQPISPNIEDEMSELQNPTPQQNPLQDSQTVFQPLIDFIGTFIPNSENNDDIPNSEFEHLNNPITDDINMSPPLTNPASNENVPQDSQLGFQLPDLYESSNQNDQINFGAFNPNSEDVVTPQLDNSESNENLPHDSQTGFQPLLNSFGTFVNGNNGNTDIPNPVLENFNSQFDTNTQDASIIPQVSNPVFNNEVSQPGFQNPINIPESSGQNHEIKLMDLFASLPTSYENSPQDSPLESQQPLDIPETSNQKDWMYLKPYIPNPNDVYITPQFIHPVSSNDDLSQDSQPEFLKPTDIFESSNQDDEISLKPLIQDVTLPLSNPVSYENLPDGSQSEFQQPPIPELSNQNEQQSQLNPTISNPENVAIPISYDNTPQNSELEFQKPFETPKFTENHEAEIQPINPNIEEEMSQSQNPTPQKNPLQDIQPVLQPLVDFIGSFIPTSENNDDIPNSELEHFDNPSTDDVNIPPPLTNLASNENTPQDSQLGFQEPFHTHESSNPYNQIDLNPVISNPEDGQHITPQFINPVSYENMLPESHIGSLDIPDSSNQNNPISFGGLLNKEDATSQITTNPVSNDATPEILHPGLQRPFSRPESSNQNDETDLLPFNPDSQNLYIQPQLTNQIENLPGILQPGFELPLGSVPELYNQNDQIDLDAFNPNTKDVTQTQLTNVVSKENPPQDSQSIFQPLIDFVGSFINDNNGNSDTPNSNLVNSIPFQPNNQPSLEGNKIEPAGMPNIQSESQLPEFEQPLQNYQIQMITL